MSYQSKEGSSSEQTTVVTSTANNTDRLPTRVCSNSRCQNEETKFKPFKNCYKCSAAYCSGKCRKQHIEYHLKNECTGDGGSDQTGGVISAQRSPSSLSQASIRYVSDMLDLVVQTGDTVHQSLSKTKRLSKYTSMNDNNRRNSLNIIKTTPSNGPSSKDDNFLAESQPG